MHKRLGVVLAIVLLGLSPAFANALTVPIDSNTIAPTLTGFQQTAAALANGAAQIVTSIEAAVGSIVGDIAYRLTGVDPPTKALSYTASAAAAVASNPVVANTADQPIASTSPAPTPPPTATTTEVIVEKQQPVIEAAPSVTNAQFSALLGSLHDLLVLLPSTVPSASGGGSADFTTTQQEIAALQREVAQTNQINNLSNVTLSSPTIVSPSIAGLSTSQVSEGSNLYFTNARVASYIDSSSTIPSVAGGTFGNLLSWNGTSWAAVATSSLGLAGTSAGTWGTISGTLANQTDLQSALDARLALSDWYATTTSALAEGSTNLYFTAARAQAAIGFGTTTANAWSALQIFNGGASTANLSVSGTLFAVNASTTNATSTNLFASLASFGTVIANTVNASIANIVGFTATYATTTNLIATDATTTNFAALGTSYFASNVGIGTSTPPAPLTIDSTSTNGTILRISNASNGGHIFDLLSTGSGNTSGAGRLDIFDYTDGVARLSIAADGFVGIGTTTPWGMLSISSANSANPELVVGSSTATSLFVSNAGDVGIDNVAPAYPLDVIGYINTDQNSGYKQGGATIFTVSATTSSIALGPGVNSTNAYYNVGIGYNAFASDTTGGTDVAIGDDAMGSMITGGGSVAIGYNALFAATSSTQNVALGRDALATTTGFDSTGLGYRALFNDVGGGNTAVGDSAGVGVSGSSNSNNNVFIGLSAGSGHTTGSNNTFLGYQSGGNLTTGSDNIVIGQGVGAASTTQNQQLNIGDVLFGSGLYNGGAVSSAATAAGKIGIGTSNPYSRLQVTGPDAASTSAFAVVNSASTTEFTVYDTGNATLAGSLVQNSDQRLKTNIQDLDRSSSLAEIAAMNPVTFNWIDPAKSSVPQYGFIAQQVQSVFPNLVSTTSPTALTPDGTLSLNYIDLISPIVAAIQELDREITSLASTVAGFAEHFATQHFTAHDVTTQQLCVGSTCVTPAQFQAMVAAANQSASTLASFSTSAATYTPPIIAINGDNPATIQVGASYADLGATITGPQADLNLSIKTFLNGALASNIVLDTSAAATDTIDYVVTDSQGLTSTSTRTVVIQPANDNQASASNLPANDNAPATSTAISTAQ